MAECIEKKKDELPLLEMLLFKCAYDYSRFSQNIRLHTGTRENVVLLTYLLNDCHLQIEGFLFSYSPGISKRLGLSGRPTDVVGVLATSKMYMLGDQLLTFFPQVQFIERFEIYCRKTDHKRAGSEC